MAAPETREHAALERLRMVRVAKDLFLSDWYREACAVLRFSEPACRVFDEIAEESAQERENVMDVIARWSRRLDEGALADASARVAHAARRDFLDGLIQAKEASGAVLERAALLAPGPLRDDLERLAEVDYRHATQLRTLLIQEAEAAWRTRSREGA